MALLPSNMMPLGTQAPHFALTEVRTESIIDLNYLAIEKGLVVMFICNHCPYVVHVADTLVNIARDFADKGITFVAINSNDAEAYPEDSPEKMVKFANNNEFPFPYCFDENQEIAKAYDAACTPDIYFFNEDKKLIYRGQIDDSRPGNEAPKDGKDLREALNRHINGENQKNEQKPSTGCSIKWKN